MKTEKKQIVFIVNPISGTSRKKGFDGIASKVIDKDKYDYEIIRTEYAGHARELAQHFADLGYFACVAVGGDGTVNEVASALVDRQTALGIVPSGSGNGLGRHLCLPMSMKGALGIINQGYVDSFDYGLINDHPFFCTCGMGFDAHVSMLFAHSGKRGLVTYARTVLREGMKYKGEEYDVTFDDGKGEPQHQKAYLIACANAAQYGNNTYIAPGASMQDGLIDVIIMEPFSGLDAPKVLLGLFTKSILHNPHVRHLQVQSLHIHRQQAGAVHYDGDPIVMDTDIDVRIVPRGLRVLANPNSLEEGHN